MSRVGCWTSIVSRRATDGPGALFASAQNQGLDSRLVAAGIKKLHPAIQYCEEREANARRVRNTCADLFPSRIAHHSYLVAVAQCVFVVVGVAECSWLFLLIFTHHDEDRGIFVLSPGLKCRRTRRASPSPPGNLYEHNHLLRTAKLVEAESTGWRNLPHHIANQVAHEFPISIR